MKLSILRGMNESTIFMLDAEGYVTSHSAEAERIKVWIAGDTSVQYLFFCMEPSPPGWICSIWEGKCFKSGK
jgi:hypothetical protein